MIDIATIGSSMLVVFNFVKRMADDLVIDSVHPWIFHVVIFMANGI